MVTWRYVNDLLLLAFLRRKGFLRREAEYSGGRFDWSFDILTIFFKKKILDKASFCIFWGLGTGERMNRSF